MASPNMGSIDRIVRIVIGAALVLWFFLDGAGGFAGGGFWHWIKLIGIVPIITGLVGTCPMYRRLGISTCRTKTP